MLTIRQRQFDQLNDVMDDAFESRLVDVIAKALVDVPDRPKDGELRELVHTSRERAAMLNITADADVAVFVAFVVASFRFNKEEGAQFRAWIVPFLQRESSAGGARMALAERSLRGKAAEHALAARMCALADSVRSAFVARTV